MQARFKDIDVDRDKRVSEIELRDWIAKPGKLDLLRDSARIDRAERRRAVQQRHDAREPAVK